MEFEAGRTVTARALAAAARVKLEQTRTSVVEWRFRVGGRENLELGRRWEGGRGSNIFVHTGVKRCGRMR